MKITSREFGKTKKGDTVTEYTMTNDSGASASILTLGGVISEIKVPDTDGKLKNVVVGYKDPEGYENCPDFIGAAIGRSGGRIAGGKLTIDGCLYQLDMNQNPNNLHGGAHAFDKQIWEASEYMDHEKASITLHYLSPDMEEGFPGNLDTNITYTFDNKNTLTIRYKCTTDKKTFVNLTNHSYFNLSGDFSTKITDHLLTMKADHFVAVDEVTIPKGIVAVEGTAFDFTKEKAIGQDIDSDEEQIKLGKGYDHAIRLNQPCQGPHIVVRDPKSGRKMEVTTKEECVVFYTGNFLKPSYITKEGSPLHPRAAFCLETQYYPDSMNHDFIKPIFLSPGKSYETITSFKFSY